jgi:hypothetical protein
MFHTCGLTSLFFGLYDSFRIADDILILIKDGNDTSVKKLTIVYVSATKHNLKVDICPGCHKSLPSQLWV